MTENKKGMLFIISGPAGSGKGTIVNALLEKDANFAVSISMTSRPMLAGESEGVNYYYVNRDEFMRRIKAEELLEYTEYCGNFYGTPKDKVEELLDKGKNLILEIETDGAFQVKRIIPDAVLIMVIPPNVKVQEERLRSRGRDEEESIQRRLLRAKEEIKLLPEYDFVIVNEDGRVDEATDAIINIGRAMAHTPRRNLELMKNYYKN